MKAAILHAANQPLQIEDVPIPTVTPGHTLLRVLACGVCRTDLHIFEGELPLSKNPSSSATRSSAKSSKAPPRTPLGTRVGVSWIGGTDGTCPFCLRHEENLCDNPTFTGYTVNGGYAEYALVRSDFIYPLPATLDDTHVAPLLCAGIIGFRSLRVAGIQPGDRVGLFGFGASAILAIAVLRHWNCEVYVSTRGENHRELADPARSKLGRHRKRQAPRPTRPRHHLRPQRSRRHQRPLQPPQRRHRRHQRHPPRPDARLRLRQPPLGRTPDPQRSQHDPPGRPRLPRTRRRNRHQAASPDLPPRPRQRSPASRKKRNRQRPLRHPPLTPITSKDQVRHLDRRRRLAAVVERPRDLRLSSANSLSSRRNCYYFASYHGTTMNLATLLTEARNPPPSTSTNSPHSTCSASSTTKTPKSRRP